MAVGEIAAQTLSRRGPRPAPAVVQSFRDIPLSRLRATRDRLAREGQHGLALQAALELAERDPSRENTFRAGYLLREVGRYREALRMFRDALRFRDGAKYLLPEIHLHVAHTWFLLGNPKRMGEAIRRALALRPKTRTDSKIHLMLGNFHFAVRRYSEAAAEYARAEAAATNPRDRGGAATNQGNALVHARRIAEARPPLERALRLHRRAGDRAALAVTRVSCAALYFDMGQPRRALGMLVRAAWSYRTLGKADREAGALQNAGYVAGEMGLLPKSRAFLDRAIRLASSAERRDLLVRAYACRAWVFVREDGFEEGSRDLDHAARLLRGHRDPIGTMFVCRTQARIAALFGSWAEARRAARHGERVAAKLGDLPRVVEFRRIRAGAEEQLGRRRAALHARAGAGRLDDLRLNGVRVDRDRRVALRLARSRLPILIVGEDGTGASALAAEIHRAGGRRPFVQVPCEQLALAASALAGHVPGAWSGAVRASEGLARRASGGTLVLDRVDELDRQAQNVVARLCDGFVRPLGSAVEERIDLRIIATCRDEERLLPELRHRLSGAVLRLAPLRDRRGEIAGLVEIFLAGRRPITADAMADLVRRPWPGNGAELRAAIERLVAFSGGPIGIRLVQRVLKTPESFRPAAPVDRKRAVRRLALAMA